MHPYGRHFAARRAEKVAVKESWSKVRERIFNAVLRKMRVLAVTTLLVAVGTPIAANARALSPVVPLLLKSGEVIGIKSGKCQIFQTAAAVRNGAGEVPTEAAIKRYEAEGLVEAAIVRLHDRAEPTAKGISSVFSFETPSGAKSEMKAELNEDPGPQALRIEGNRYLVQRHFTVPGVRGAGGIAVVSSDAARKLGLEFGVAKGLFIEGSCLVAIGIFRPTSNDVTRLVVNGIQAVSERTGDSCP